MIEKTQIETRLDRKRRHHELARGILSVGLFAFVFYGALTLLRRKKVLILPPLMAFVFLLLAVALLGTCAKTFRDRQSK
jgi:hypothetical protein